MKQTAVINIVKNRILLVSSKMRFFTMFITAVCFMFLIILKCPFFIGKKRLDAEDHATKNKTTWLICCRKSVKEMLVPDVTLSADKTKLIARLVLRQKGKIF